MSNIFETSFEMSEFVLQASFSMSGNRTDIDINDPDFWKKWAKKADVDVEGLKHKVQYGCSFSYMYMQTLLYLQYVYL